MGARRTFWAATFGSVVVSGFLAGVAVGADQGATPFNDA